MKTYNQSTIIKQLRNAQGNALERLTNAIKRDSLSDIAGAADLLRGLSAILHDEELRAGRYRPNK